MSRRRVVVTGLGCVSPVGNTVAEAWANILAGQSGIDLITKFDASNFACKIAGEVKGFDLNSYISAKDARTMDSFIHYGIAAAQEAVQDAGLPTGEALDEELATRIGCIIGSGIGGLPLIENTHAELASRGPRRITPFFVPASIINMVAGHVSMRFGFKGPNLSVVTACTTGLHHGSALHRRRRALDRVRRCRRDRGRRQRSDRVAPGRGRFRRHARPVHPQ